MATSHTEKNEKAEKFKSEFRANVENSNELVRELIGEQSKQITKAIDANKKLVESVSSKLILDDTRFLSKAADLWATNLKQSASLIEQNIEATKKLTQHNAVQFLDLYDKQFDWFYSWWKE